LRSRCRVQAPADGSTKCVELRDALDDRLRIICAPQRNSRLVCATASPPPGRRGAPVAIKLEAVRLTYCAWRNGLAFANPSEERQEFAKPPRVLGSGTGSQR
jgi:hypothetical protein